MAAMQTVVILVLAVLTCSNPLLLLWAWIQRFMHKHDERQAWRTFLLWIGLTAATIAVVAFWMGTQYAPTAPAQNDLLFKRFLRGSILMACTALLASIVGRGRERKWIAASALITPLSWFWALLMM
jgi:peptidoglycan biosynthesis protein MviN/MurJ (putative lipid II flippase)